jgi:DNA-binding response OmpR family regulator
MVITVNEETGTRDDKRTAARRALLVSDEGADGKDGADELREKIARAGFAVERATAKEAARRVEEFAPDVVVIAFDTREGESGLVSLARRLRSEPATFALPLVFLFRADARTLRSAARHLGADDYIARDASAEELRARLEALLWRVEAGRRSAPAIADQRSEIDNFLFLLDAVSADIQQGKRGALALVETDEDGARYGDAGDAHGRALVAAHGFLKLNLRRVDAVAFYGPATLLVYLPGADESAARQTLARLREEFLESRAARELFVGVSSFPAQGGEVEKLVEQAGAALEKAREVNSRERVVVYDVEGSRGEPVAEEGGETREAAGASVESSAREAARGVASVGAVEDSASRVSDDEARGVEDSGRQAARASSAGAGAVERRAGGKIRRLMLVVSDAARMAQVNLLLRSEGYEVRAAFDGQHALNLLRIDRPDLLVVDYELKGMNGVEMLRRLAKQSGAGATPPALLLAPAGRAGLREEASAAGARAVVGLPYDPVELLEMVRGFVETP